MRVADPVCGMTIDGETARRDGWQGLLQRNARAAEPLTA